MILKAAGRRWTGSSLCALSFPGAEAGAAAAPGACSAFSLPCSQLKCWAALWLPVQPSSETWVTAPVPLLPGTCPGRPSGPGGFGVESLRAPGADHAAVRRDTPTAKLCAGLSLLGLTQTAPKVNRFVKCSRSLTLSLWVRSPRPECAALCLRRGSKSPELPVT